jgi:putative CocE/NonD family hydrolase
VPYDPRNGPFLKTMISASATPPNTRRLQFDHRHDEARVASWTSAPLSAAVEMTGFPTLTLWAASSGTDADFVVQLTDVAPDGYSKTVIAGYLNGPRQAYTDRNTAAVAPPVPLEPGVPRKFTIKLLPASYVFPAGHRIRIAVAGGAEIGPGADGQPQNAPQGPGRNPDAYELTLYQGDKYPSALELPLVGEGAQVLQKQ